MSANLVAGSNGALDTLANGTGTNGTVNGINGNRYPEEKAIPITEPDEEEEETPEVDINISNVVCHFSTRCHLNLRQIATRGLNVEHRRDQGVVKMKIRKPRITASIWSSGKITCTGAKSEDEAKLGARRVARVLQKLSFKVKISSYRVVNVLGSVILPFGIKIADLTEHNRQACSYEPELNPGATYRYKEAGATLKIYQTGAITINAPTVQRVELAVQHIYPLVFEFKKEKPPQSMLSNAHKRPHNNQKNSTNGNQNGSTVKRRRLFEGSEEDVEEDEDIEEVFQGAESEDEVY